MLRCLRHSVGIDFRGAVVSVVLPFPATRTLAQVLAELMLAEGELRRLDTNIGKGDPSPEQDARWSKLEDAIWLRRDEAKAMIEAATGVPWNQIEGANL